MVQQEETPWSLRERGRASDAGSRKIEEACQVRQDPRHSGPVRPACAQMGDTRFRPQIVEMRPQDTQEGQKDFEAQRWSWEIRIYVERRPRCSEWGIWKLRIPTGDQDLLQQEPGDGLAVRWGRSSACQLKVQSTHRGEPPGLRGRETFRFLGRRWDKVTPV